MPNSDIYGEVHNAKVCTIDQSDHWIASFETAPRRFAGGVHNVEAHDTEAAAIEWLRTEARRRDLRLVQIRVRGAVVGSTERVL